MIIKEHSKTSHIASTAAANVAICSALLLAACSSGGDSTTSADVISLPTLAVRGLGDQEPTEVLRPWHVFIFSFRSEFRTPDSSNARVITVQNEPTTSVQTYIDFYSTQVELETCNINSEDSTDINDGGPLMVSAGDSVSINAPNGTWLTLPEEDVGFYEPDDGLPGAIPAGASVSIPGDVFPSVGAVPIAEPAAPERIAPMFGPVSIESEYQWQATDVPGTYIQLGFIEIDPNTGDFASFPATCFVEDDGEFQLPTDVQDLINNSSNPIEVRYERRLGTLELVEGVIAYSRIAVVE